MARDHIVKPRRMWTGVVVALVGICLIALWTATWERAIGIAGGVLLVIGGATAAWGGVLYDTHGRPVSGELQDLREGGGHEGTAPGDMITKPGVRTDAALTARRIEATRLDSQPQSRPALRPLGSWLLLIGAVSLVVAQGRYPESHTGQDNATRSLLIAVVVGLAALRLMLAQRPGRLPSAAGVLAGVLLVVLALVTDHDRHAMVVFEVVAGAWILVAGLLSLDRPREYPAPASLPAPPLSTPARSGRPGRKRSRLRTVLGVLLFVLGAARALRERRARRRARRLAAGRAGSLRYVVPVGQDPAAVIAALRQAGYDVVREHEPTRIQELVIACPGGVDGQRSDVRAVIAHAPMDLGGAPPPEHRVVFADEPEAAPPAL